VLKKLVAPVVVAGIVLGGVAATGVAYANTPTASVSASVKATGTVHNLRAWLRAHRRQIRRAGIAISAQTIGVTPQDLVGELRSGKSIAEVAGEHDVSTQSVIDALVTAADAKITLAVANHRITSQQGAWLEGVVPGFVTKQVNRTF